MQTLQIRLSREQIRRIDQSIKKGVYKSRSDAIRDALEKIHFFLLLNRLGKFFDGKIPSQKNMLRELGNIREEIYTKYL